MKEGVHEIHPAQATSHAVHGNLIHLLSRPDLGKGNQDLQKLLTIVGPQVIRDDFPLYRPSRRPLSLDMVETGLIDNMTR